MPDTQDLEHSQTDAAQTNKNNTNENDKRSEPSAADHEDNSAVASASIAPITTKPIVAIASGSTPSAIAILRISGDGCLNLIKPILKAPGEGGLPPGMFKLCKFSDPSKKIIIDEPMAVFFKGPRSYTGEDSLEIYLHGGPYIVRTCLEILWKNGFTQANPGEFTERAFINGKLDLAAAEGIKEIIHANSDQQWLAARQLATGKLSVLIDDLRKKLIEAMAWLEARIDFPDEEETSAVELQEVTTRVQLVKSALTKLKHSYDSGKVASTGLAVALFGRPNCGKSTLMNELLGEDRAIVSPHAGTTRDYLEESCLIQGRLMRLIDTAGIRETDDSIEKIGVARSLKIAKKSDVVLLMLPADASAEAQLEMNELATMLTQTDASQTDKSGTHQNRQPKIIKIVSKSDLGHKNWSEGQIEVSCQIETALAKAELPQDRTQSSHAPSSCDGISSHGLDKLKQKLVSIVDQHVEPLREGTFITSARHLHSINESLQYIEKFEQGIEEGVFEEMLAFELLGSARAIAAVVGKIDNDDILKTVFGSFCVGK